MSTQQSSDQPSLVQQLRRHPATELVVAVLSQVWKWIRVGWGYASRAIGSLVLGLIIIGLVGGLLGSGISDVSYQSPLQKKLLTSGGSDQVAVVDLSGPIVSDVPSGELALSSSVISAQKTSQLLDRLATESDVKAVVLRINSPGGSVVASDELYLAIKELAAQKVVVAWLGDTAASGGYYVALGADQIVANRATVTGSIGVLAQFPQISGLLDTLGIEMRVIKSGQFKDLGSPTQQLTPEEIAILESVVDDAYQQFIDRLVTGRDMERDTALTLADGRIFTGQQAFDRGLVDQIGSFDQAVDIAATQAEIDDPSVVEYVDQSFLEMVLSAASPQLQPLQAINQLVPQRQFGLYYLFSL